MFFRTFFSYYLLPYPPLFFPLTSLREVFIIAVCDGERSIKYNSLVIHHNRYVIIDHLTQRSWRVGWSIGQSDKPNQDEG